MFIHIGENEYVDLNDIILIVDVNSGLDSKDTINFLKNIESKSEIIHLFSNQEKEKSIVVVCKKNKKRNNKTKIYYTSISSTTLYKRSKNIEESSFEMEVI